MQYAIDPYSGLMVDGRRSMDGGGRQALPAAASSD
jgi:hypothetical protein